MSSSLLGPRSIVRALFFLFAVAFVSSSAFAQIPQAGDTTTPPIPGAGHDYIQSPIDTINPSNGSLSLRIPVRTASSRGITLPFAFAYDSAGVNYLTAGTQGSPTWATTLSLVSSGGWSNTVPVLSVSELTWTIPNGLGGNQTCGAGIDYVLQDAQGGRHNLNLSVVGYVTSGPQNCSTGSDGGKAQTTQGGDAPIVATTTAIPNYQPIMVEPVTVTDADGTAYYFGGYTFVPVPTTTLIPKTITDRNGNVITGNLSAGSSAYSFTDSIGRTDISDSGVGTSPETVTVSGLSYTVDWTTLSAPTFTSTFTNFGPQNCTTASHRGFTAVSSITLPNGKSYSITYDPVYGMPEKVILPTGGYIRYQWGMDSQAEYASFIIGPPTNQIACQIRYDIPAVTDRYVSYDGSTEVLHQHFTYAQPNWNGNTNWTTKTTSVTTTDNVRNTSFTTVYTYTSLPAERAPNDPQVTTNEVAVEQCDEYYDITGSGGTPPSQCANLSPSGKLLKTEVKSWDIFQDLLTAQTVLDNNKSSLTVYCYNVNDEVTETDEYDFGTSTPSGACRTVPSGTQSGGMLRKTNTAYATFTPHIVDKPSSVITYDGSGTRDSETDFTSYDPKGNLLTQKKDCFAIPSGTACPQGNSTTTFTYDSNGQMLTMVDPNGNAAGGTPSAHTTTYSYSDTYTPCGGAAPPSSPSDAYLTQITYPPTNGVTHTVKYCYDYSKGLMLSSTDQNSQPTTYAYNTPPSGCSYSDGLDRLSSATYPDGGLTTYCYNDTAPTPTLTTKQLISSGTYVTNVTTFNGFGATIKSLLTSDPDCASGDRTDTTYDGPGRVYTVSNPYCSTSDPTYGITTYTYDALGRTTTIKNPDTSTATTSYTGRATEVTDESGKQRITQVDGLGRLTSVCEVTTTTLTVGISGSTTPAACSLDISATGFATTYPQYDALADLMSVNQGPLNSRSFGYNSLSDLTSASNPESGTTSYTYDPNENLLTKTDARSATVTYAYDADNHVTGKTYSDSTPAVTYNYDETLSQGVTLTNTNGRTSSESTAGTYPTVTVFSYDPMGRINNNSQHRSDPPSWNTLVSQPYSYDLLGNVLTSVMVPGAGAGTITNTYNGASRLSGTTNSGTPTTIVSGAHYNALGERTSQTLGNGLTETWTYDNRGRVSSYSLNNGSTTNYSYSVSYYPNGNVMSSNDSVNSSWVYGYDDFNRLTSASVSNGTYRLATSWTYAYDRFGNRWQQNVTAGSGPSSSLSFDANNHIIGSGLAYDAAGNVTDDGTNTYTYDPEGRIASVPSLNATYYYDGDGRRGVVYATNQTYPYWYRIYNLQDQEIGRCSPTYGCVNDEYYEGNRHIVSFGGPTLFDHPDWIGTERYRTETNGTTYGYCLSDPFGDGLSCPEADGDISEIHFTGKEFDNGNTENPDLLYNFGARYYAYWLGSFMTPDWSASPEPIPYAELRNPQSLNLYAYVTDNPVTFADKDGHHLECKTKTSIGPNGEIIQTITCREVPDPSFWDLFRLYWRTSDPDLKRALGYQMLGMRSFTIPVGPAQNTLGPALPSVPIPLNVLKVLDLIDKLGTAPPGTEGGKAFQNDGRGGGEILPKTDADGNPVTYREWDVNPSSGGAPRDAERIVTGTDGSAYYTKNHYQSFTKIR